MALIEASKARRISNKELGSWAQWRKNRHKANAWSNVVENTMMYANSNIKEKAKEGKNTAIVFVTEKDLYIHHYNKFGAYDASKLNKEEKKQVFESGIAASIKLIKEKGYRVTVNEKVTPPPLPEKEIYLHIEWGDES